MLALLPLDNRPCNVRFPQQIAAIGGDELTVPLNAVLGRFSTPGKPAALREWLHALADGPPLTALIVSIDMLAYGGLVASRRPVVSFENAIANLQVLRDFRHKRPDTPIYAFNILMRLAVTMDSDAAIANYYDIIRYARLADEAERFHSDYLRAELDKVTAAIPPAVLGEYQAARARNHAVNATMIDWLADGVFDYLLITQEDATEFGLHRREQDALMARLQERDGGKGEVASHFSLHPGADEAALTLLARHWNTGARFRVHWSNHEDAHRIAPFEDRPYDEALAQHIAAMRGVLTEEDTADFELFVNAPVGGSQKDESQAEQAQRDARLRDFVRDLIGALEAGRRVALCDVAFPNGADDLLMTELEKRGALGKLAAFGGWNTAGNTTGTLLAQCAALLKTQDATASSRLNRDFLFERLLDDWFYQTRIRTRIEKSAREQDISPINMGDKGAPIEALARRELRGFARILAGRHFGATLERCDVTLPWARTFEVDLRAELV